MPDLRVYGATTGQESTFYFPFLDPTASDGSFRTTTPSPAVGDLTLYLDGVDTATTSATLTWLGDGYGKLVLTAAQMQAQIIVAIIIDQSATKLWVDTSIIIHTGGHASALHSG